MRRLNVCAVLKIEGLYYHEMRKSPETDRTMTLSGTLPAAAIREKFIRFFEKNGHQALSSASLVPTNPTVLLTPAGMLPFVPVFLGIEPPPDPPRVVTAQKCARVSGKASDLEYVGRTPRHHTFFEMLGNFSFGDYFKKEAIRYAWTFITEELGLPEERLWITVYKDDMEARDIWRDAIGIPENRILFCDEKDNFWGPPGPTGPCGPCTEIHYDRGETDAYPGTPDKNPALMETDRFVEIWNLVFMELFQDDAGNRTPLEKKNVDTGMGLERIAMVVQGKNNTFETDLLFPVVEAVGKAAGIKYGQSAETDVALKIAADHIRCVVFAVADGIAPSNEGRGYIIRMLLRRAVRYGKKYLGFDGPFLYKLVATVRDLYQAPYQELKEKYSHIVDVVKTEEKRFFETLERGSRMLDDTIANLKEVGKTELPGDEAFKLYDTYGFPLELTVDIAGEEGLTVDLRGFEAAMAEQKDRARSARKGGAIVSDQLYSQILDEVGPTKFVGYETLTAEAAVLALVSGGERVMEVAGTNRPFEVVLDQTPFYAESGGQVGDRGSFSEDEGHHGLTVVVNDCKKVGDLYVHQCLFDQGEPLKVGDRVVAQVDPVARQLAAIHHSATHLLHAALKKVLGEHVSQAGSNVTPDGARFDFTFNRALKPNEIQRVEYLVNKWIMENVNRHTEILSLEEAKRSGAVAMFGEKYGDRVRVVAFGGHSKELCGGTHVDQLGEIGLVKITSEGAIASGIRRLEYVAGEQAYKLFKQLEQELNEMAALLKAPVRDVPQKVERLLEDLKEREKAVLALEEKLAVQAVLTLKDEITEERPYLIRKMSGQSVDALKLMAEKLVGLCNQEEQPCVILLATDANGKAGFVCAVSGDLVSAGVKAGDLVKEAAAVTGGGGGGRPNFAQAGGKDPGRIDEALQQAEKKLKGQLKAAPAGS